MPFEFESAKAFGEFCCKAKDPAPVNSIADWLQRRIEEDGGGEGGVCGRERDLQLGCFEGWEEAGNLIV